MQRRKVTYRLYPNLGQTKALGVLLRRHQELYNALLEERISAYRLQGKTLTFAEQCRSITAVRQECPEYAELNGHALQVIAKRVDLAFKAFFRRVRERKDKAGFPRFQSLRRFSGWGYKEHGCGWRLQAGKAGKHGRLRLMGVGLVRIRGRARNEGVPKTCEILHKNGRWYASVTLVCEPKRKRGRAKVGLDWGVETFATVAHGGGKVETIENPQCLKAAKAKLTAAQRSLDGKKRGSKNREKARRVVARLHERVANKRLNFLHQISAVLVSLCKVIITEKLSVSNMTSSAKGTVEQPGKNVRQKAGLNRNILDTSPSAFLQMLRYKAEEAGAAYVEVNTRRWAPSQTCHRCKGRRKKALSEREHVCECGARCGRDENAARVLVGLLGREPAQCGGCAVGSPAKHETPTVAA
jgi:putative transposase